jgi:pantothenate kinase
MMLVGMYPTEWDLPKQDKEELMMLVGMYPKEWEQRAREVRERLAKTEQARLRLIVSSAGESGQARPEASPFGKLVAALR